MESKLSMLKMLNYYFYYTVNAGNLTGRVLNSTSIGLDWELPDSVMDDIVDHYLVNVEEMELQKAQA